MVGQCYSAEPRITQYLSLAIDDIGVGRSRERSQRVLPTLISGLAPSFLFCRALLTIRVLSNRSSIR